MARHRLARFATILVAALMVIGGAVPNANAQPFQVIHNFGGGLDGALPSAGLTMDKEGRLYGTTFQGGQGGFGVVFKLTPSSSGWIYSLLYSFNGNNNGVQDGGNPSARVIFGPDGALYGTTVSGGLVSCNYCGTVFKLSPPICRSTICPWTETILYSFRGGTDGALPYSEVVFDASGNLYGTTESGGSHCQYGCGTAYKLSRLGTGWEESILYNFTGGLDGLGPTAGLIFDSLGRLYGTAPYSNQGFGGGTVFQLARSRENWALNVLYSFQNGTDGGQPYAGLIFDGSGDLFGVAAAFGQGNGGTAFELSPPGSWSYSLIASFSGSGFLGPYGTLLMDSAGNLYGTTLRGGTYNAGTVFKLTFANGIWTQTVLHNFTGGSDGGDPYGNVVMDKFGNIYGTASMGGQFGVGVVWKITPQH